jgi:uncharacterized protein (TIGR01777 family)
LIGSALRQHFIDRGHEVISAGRHGSTDGSVVKWDAENGFSPDDLPRLEGLDAVVHLAGESISALRWTDEKKKAIRDSRVLGTRNLVNSLAGLKKKPDVLAAASAIGFYGDRGDDELTESCAAGDNFLPKTTLEWEAEARRAEDLGIRTVLLRTGIVLSKAGGALATMLTPFKLGVGGVMGSGKQWMSWISMDDIVAIYDAAVTDERMRGAVNAVAPNPVVNEEFTKTLGEVLYRPTFLPIPEFAVNLMFGEMGDALLLDSTRVVPQRLNEAGFSFRFPDLKPAIESAVK